MTPDGVCTFYADSYCQADQKCSPDFEAYWNDLATCKERSKISCLSRLTAPGVNDTPARVVSCASALASLSCPGFIDFDRWPETCTPPPGQGADGSPCIVPGQCQGTRCMISSRVACGTCATVSRIGGACTSETDCLNFVPCVGGICVPHPNLGEPCDGFSRDCVPGSVCRDIGANGLGTCAKPSPPGTPCDPTAPDICDNLNGYYCDQFSKTCEASTKPSKIGESCANTDFCTSVAFCSFDGICQAKPKEGAPCDSGDFCMTPARCIDYVCKIRDPDLCK